MINYLILRIKQDQLITPEMCIIGGVIRTNVRVGYMNITLDKEDKIFNWSIETYIMFCRIYQQTSNILLSIKKNFSIIIDKYYIKMSNNTHRYNLLEHPDIN